jgi:hypothetical protein
VVGLWCVWWCGGVVCVGCGGVCCVLYGGVYGGVGMIRCWCRVSAYMLNTTNVPSHTKRDEMSSYLLPIESFCIATQI